MHNLAIKNCTSPSLLVPRIKIEIIETIKLWKEKYEYMIREIFDIVLIKGTWHAGF